MYKRCENDPSKVTCLGEVWKWHEKIDPNPKLGLGTSSRWFGHILHYRPCKYPKLTLDYRVPPNLLRGLCMVRCFGPLSIDRFSSLTGCYFFKTLFFVSLYFGYDLRQYDKELSYDVVCFSQDEIYTSFKHLYTPLSIPYTRKWSKLIKKWSF